jgi:dienelactone hydrolase
MTPSRCQDATQLDGVLVGSGPAGVVLLHQHRAVAALRAHGAKRIALVGASLGASTALLAGAALRPPVAAVVSLSTGKFDLATRSPASSAPTPAAS